VDFLWINTGWLISIFESDIWSSQAMDSVAFNPEGCLSSGEASNHWHKAIILWWNWFTDQSVDGRDLLKVIRWAILWCSLIVESSFKRRIEKWLN
jgi:hypothetical protein